jgi:peptidyl-tRNA hydrolase
MDTAAWVLERFSLPEEQALPALLATAADALDAWLFEGLDAAMNRFNRAERPLEAGPGG